MARAWAAFAFDSKSRLTTYKKSTGRPVSCARLMAWAIAGWHSGPPRMAHRITLILNLQSFGLRDRVFVPTSCGGASTDYAFVSCDICVSQSSSCATFLRFPSRTPFRHHSLHFRFRNPRMRRTLLRSTLATGKSLEKERRTRFDFLRRRWLRRCFRRRNFPLPVILKRFAVALCVFILGIVSNTSLFSLYQLGFWLFSISNSHTCLTTCMPSITHSVA